MQQRTFWRASLGIAMLDVFASGSGSSVIEGRRDEQLRCSLEAATTIDPHNIYKCTAQHLPISLPSHYVPVARAIVTSTIAPSSCCCCRCGHTSHIMSFFILVLFASARFHSSAGSLLHSSIRMAWFLPASVTRSLRRRRFWLQLAMFTYTAIVCSIWSPLELAAGVVRSLPLLDGPVTNASSTTSLTWLAPDHVPPLITRSLSGLRGKKEPSMNDLLRKAIKDFQGCARDHRRVDDIHLICRRQDSDACSKVRQPPGDQGMQIENLLVLQHCVNDSHRSSDVGYRWYRGSHLSWRDYWPLHRHSFKYLDRVPESDMGLVMGCLDQHVLPPRNTTGEDDPCDMFFMQQPHKDLARLCHGSPEISSLEELCRAMPKRFPSGPRKRHLMPVQFSDVSSRSPRVSRCVQENGREDPDADPNSIEAHCQDVNARQNAYFLVTVGTMIVVTAVGLLGIYIKWRKDHQREKATRLIREAREAGVGIWEAHRTRLRELQGNTFNNGRIPEEIEDEGITTGIGDHKRAYPIRWYQNFLGFWRRGNRDVNHDDERGTASTWTSTASTGTGEGRMTATETFTIPPAPGNRVMNVGKLGVELGKKKKGVSVENAARSGGNGGGQQQQHQRAVSTGATTTAPRRITTTPEMSETGQESNGSRRRQPSGEEHKQQQ